MALPTDLSLRIDQASKALAANEFGTLRLPYRTKIWAAMGSKQLDKDGIASGAGVKRRTQLSIMCIRKVLPIFESAFPGVTEVEEIISLTESIMNGRLSKNEAKSKIDEYHAWYEDLEGDDWARGVAQAAVAASYAALYDMDWIDSSADEGEMDEGYWDGSELTDEEIDPQDWDASYCASSAAADGPLAEPGSECSRKRGQFWHWYLTEAVPQAYESVPD